jgi:hypothetical protein
MCPRGHAGLWCANGNGISSPPRGTGRLCKKSWHSPTMLATPAPQNWHLMNWDNWNPTLAHCVLVPFISPGRLWWILGYTPLHSRRMPGKMEPASSRPSSLIQKIRGFKKMLKFGMSCARIIRARLWHTNQEFRCFEQQPWSTPLASWPTLSKTRSLASHHQSGKPDPVGVSIVFSPPTMSPTFITPFNQCQRRKQRVFFASPPSMITLSLAPLPKSKSPDTIARPTPEWATNSRRLRSGSFLTWTLTLNTLANTLVFDQGRPAETIKCISPRDENGWWPLAFDPPVSLHHWALADTLCTCCSRSCRYHPGDRKFGPHPSRR